MLKLITYSLLLIAVTKSAICSIVEPIKHVQGDASGSLQRDLNEFVNIVPVDSIRNLTEYFYANDGRMRDSYDYLRDRGFKLVVENLSKLTLVEKLTVVLKETGVNFAELGEGVEKIVLTDEEAQSIDVKENSNDMGGMNTFFSEALSLIPQDEVLTLFFAKIEESNAFSSFLEQLNAADYDNLMESLKRSQGLQAIYFEFHSHGIDIMECGKSLRNYFGY